MTEQSLTWFNDQFTVKIADKFNHVRITLFRTTKKFSLPGTIFLLFIKIVSY